MKLKPQTEITDASTDETRRQLLEAAGEVFAEVGFRDATVREICRRAGANIAAINYHFGDKETLYLEVLRYAHGKALAKYPPMMDLPDDAPPEKKLRAFIHSMLQRIFDKGPTSWHGKLMSREMIEPTKALDSLVEERMRPMVAQLWKIVAEILDCPVNDERVRLCSLSVISQCVFYNHCSPVVSRLFPNKLPQDSASIGHLAEHITKFSLAAMRHFSAARR
ncbi:MAG TPA: CerR family C-terminal domain-containing protein [Dongiaceae bacterium]|jgi:AcrR family transcriptional regulator|nr:CerR family C-terminal domain-containing protein [Dongiaceae bacterium]